MSHSTLHTDRLILRPPLADDLAGFAAYRQSARARFSGGPGSAADAWAMFAMVIGHWELRGYGLWTVVLRDSGRTIGSVGCLFPEGWPEREVGWHIWADADEGKGYAFEAADAALDHAFGVLGWDTAASFIAAGNLRSVALGQRLGGHIDVNAAGLSPSDVVIRHPQRGPA